MSQVCAAAVGANSLCAVPAETLAREEKALEQPLTGVLVRLASEARTQVAPNLTVITGSQTRAKDPYAQVLVDTLLLEVEVQLDQTAIWERELLIYILLHARKEHSQILLAGRNARRKLCHLVDELRHGRHCGENILERRSRHGARHKS